VECKVNYSSRDRFGHVCESVGGDDGEMEVEKSPRDSSRPQGRGR
jgi:hypothetical protein